MRREDARSVGHAQAEAGETTVRDGNEEHPAVGDVGRLVRDAVEVADLARVGAETRRDVGDRLALAHDIDRRVERWHHQRLAVAQ